MIYAKAFICSFLIAVLLTPFTVKASQKFNIYSKPKRGEITGKPCLGGAAIFLAFLVSALINLDFKKTAIGLVVSSSLIVLLGVIDDVKDLKPSAKIITQVAGVVLLIIFGIHTGILFVPTWINMMITLIWMLFITNAFNLLDIVDGLTSGLTVIISLTLFVIALLNGDMLSGVMLTALAGSHLAFLKYNYPPAKVYMGDTGSLFSGFLLAAIAINISYASLDRPYALITPILAMSLPIYDTIFLIVIRHKKQKPIFSKTNDHFALRLVTMGWSPRKSLWTMYSFSLFLALASILVVFAPDAVSIMAILATIIVFTLSAKKIGMVKIND